jgi:hypothetical protein
MHGTWAFIRTYLLRLGFLDGAQGLGVALMTSQASYYKYIKLWLLWQQAGAQPASRSRRDDRPGPSGNT